MIEFITYEEACKELGIDPDSPNLVYPDNPYFEFYPIWESGHGFTWNHEMVERFAANIEPFGLTFQICDTGTDTNLWRIVKTP